MFSGPSPHPVAIRLYGGADDSGIISIPVRRGHEPIAIALTSGIYVATGLQDGGGRLLFALAGTEESLWLSRGRSGHPEN